MELNKIYLGDAYKLIKEMPDKSVDLIMTDPPYEIKGIHKPTGIVKKKGMTYSTELNESGLCVGIDLKILDDLVRVMKKINIYIWCNKEQIYDYLTYFVKERKCNWEMIIWAKDNPPPFVCGHYLKDKEYCLYFWERGVKVQPTFETGKTVYLTSTNISDKKNYGHPTIKDIEIVKTLIQNSTGGGIENKAIVFDPFCGSATSLLAAKRLGLQWIGFEINPKYFEIAVNRMQGINARGEMNLFDIDNDN